MFIIKKKELYLIYIFDSIMKVKEELENIGERVGCVWERNFDIDLCSVCIDEEG